MHSHFLKNNICIWEQAYYENYSCINMYTRLFHKNIKKENNYKKSINLAHLLHSI